MTSPHDEVPLNHLMNQALDERRPNRYTPGDTRRKCLCSARILWRNSRWEDSVDHEHQCANSPLLPVPTAAWLDEIADDFAGAIAAQEAQRRAARAIVGRLEGVKTRSTLKIVRQCPVQKPLDWEFFQSLPLVVGNQRVAVRATNAADWRQFAEEERQRAERDNKTRTLTIEAAIWIANEMDAHNWRTGAAINW